MVTGFMLHTLSHLIPDAIWQETKVEDFILERDFSEKA